MTKEEIQKEIDLIEVYRQQALEEGQQDVAEIYESDIAETKNRMKEAPIRIRRSENIRQIRYT